MTPKIAPYLEDALMREEIQLKAVADLLSTQQFGTPAYAAVLTQNYRKLMVATEAAARYRVLLAAPEQAARKVEVLTRQLIARTSLGQHDPAQQYELAAVAQVIAHVGRLLSEVGP
jgi:hypothetical protein